MAQVITSKIVGGPGKFGLMLGLFDGQASKFRVQVDAPTGWGRIEVVVHLNSVEQEDGSLESWNLAGWVESYGGNGPLVPSHRRLADEGLNGHFKAYFKTCHVAGAPSGTMTITIG